MVHSPLSFDLISELYIYDSFSDLSLIFCNGRLSLNDEPVSAYMYSLSSMAIDDGYKVIKPTSISVGSPGRWLRISIGDAVKRQETYSGVSNASGIFSVTFPTVYAAAPNIQAQLIGGTDTQSLTSVLASATGFTVTVRNRTDLLGLLPSYSNVSGATVKVLITAV
jgi:hypothetical protein